MSFYHKIRDILIKHKEGVLILDQACQASLSALNENYDDFQEPLKKLGNARLETDQARAALATVKEKLKQFHADTEVYAQLSAELQQAVNEVLDTQCSEAFEKLGILSESGNQLLTELAEKYKLNTKS